MSLVELAVVGLLLALLCAAIWIGVESRMGRRAHERRDDLLEAILSHLRACVPTQPHASMFVPAFGGYKPVAVTRDEDATLVSAVPLPRYRATPPVGEDEETRVMDRRQG